MQKLNQSALEARGMKNLAKRKKKCWENFLIKNSQLIRPDIDRWHAAGITLCQTFINNMCAD